MFFQEVHGIQAYRQLGDKVDHLLAFAEGGFHKVKGILQAGNGKLQGSYPASGLSFFSGRPTMRQNHVNIGILAPVDAGKTTFAEALLYKTGALRSAGRVDHQDAFLDTEPMEKKRGITIVSKMAQLHFHDLSVTLVDTPGHVDFSAEMERTLQVIDYAVLIINGSDGVQGQVRTLWRLLREYDIPAFIFVNKMDQPLAVKEKLKKDISGSLSSSCLDFTAFSDFGPSGSRPENLPENPLTEEIALQDDGLTEKYLAGGKIALEDLRKLIRQRRVFPCFYGSALRLTGIDVFIDAFYLLAECPEYPDEFGARIYKITRDRNGQRLTWMKVTGGSLRVKQILSGASADASGQPQEWQEKAEQIRVYSGNSFENVQEAKAGVVCAVTGLTKTFSGEGLGSSFGSEKPLLEPVMDYALELPDGTDVHYFYSQLRSLEEEMPELHLLWKEQTGEIIVQVMGEVQTQILKNVILERFGMDVGFGNGRIVYRETIAGSSEGVGHFEPLRHYAEVHVRLESLERGSGIEVESDCSTDVLSLNWQRQILSALEDRRHAGVLTGSTLTDVRIILTGGRASLKHTSGGDFRQAAARAVRQALMKAQNVLLEPFFDFQMTVPQENLGRAMTDIEKMSGTMSAPLMENGMAVIGGRAPVSRMSGYPAVLAAYTSGQGHLTCTPGGYLPCHNSPEVIGRIGYDPEMDEQNPAGSVFCAHGAGFYVPWDQVEEYMQAEDAGGRPESVREDVMAEVSGVKIPAWETAGGPPSFETPSGESPSPASPAGKGNSKVKSSYHANEAEDRELMEIFQRTYGSKKQDRKGWKLSKSHYDPKPVTRVYSRQEPKEKYLLVDGYNIIFAWPELRDLSRTSMDAARGRLIDILGNYQGYRQETLIIVFDAYRVEGGSGEVMKFHNVYVVFTKERETADAYIERTVHKIGHQKDVTVATSDGAEQAIIFGQGARRMSAREFLEDVQAVQTEIAEKYLS